MNSYKILIIDDEESQRESLAGYLHKKGIKTFIAKSGEEGISLIKDNMIDLVLTDYKMPGMTGLDVVKQIKELNPKIECVVMTAYSNVEEAVEIMKSGAYDYLQKPVELIELMHIIENVKKNQMLVNENESLRRELNKKYSFTEIIGSSGEMENVLNTAARVASAKASVMILGESGTGKELIAKAVHYSGERKDKPFVVVNCAAMPDTLFESELFGHEKGAYTGAAKQRIGKFEQANGGTLFIDEVGDIPAQIQVKLLRAVQFGEIERLGGSKTIELDVRIITATNRNLEEMIKAGSFREDLYYRFNVVSINIPPLRKRRSDIPSLVDYFIDKYSVENGLKLKGISKQALDILMKYDFPGNVRELENIVQRAVVLCRGEYVSTEDLPPSVKSSSTDEKSLLNIQIGDINEAVQNLEIEMIKQALTVTMGNQVKAAELLKINERTIRYKIAKYAIK